MRLLIRADADARMGTGHLMRCLALAEAWRANGGAVTVRTNCAVPALLERLRAAGAEVEAVGQEPGSHTDAERTLASGRRALDASWVVIDGYHFSSEFQSRLRADGLRVLAIDDFAHAGHYSADIVLNQNLHATEGLYAGREPHTRLLLGPRYALLRREFWSPPRPTRQQGPGHNVLVTLGGSDPDNVTLKVVRALANCKVPDLQAIVVAGPANPHQAAIKAATEGLSTVKVAGDVSNMAELMAWADFAVAAGGTTTWERARMGLPSLVVVLADNQRPLAEATERAGLGRNLGDGAALDEATLARAVEQLLQDDDTRAAMSRRGPELVDGQGARRVCRILEDATFTLRLAGRDDIRRLWEWANESATRGASFTPEPIPWERHERWFPIKLTDPHCAIFLASNNPESAPFGQVRFEREGDEAVVSISLDAGCRGRGYGPVLIRVASSKAFDHWPIAHIVALIRPENESSHRAFLKAGFTPAGSTEVRGLTAIKLTLRREDACLAR